jgi:hypothetical protein
MRLPLPSLAMLATLGCTGSGFDSGDLMPNFALEDTNASSASYGELVGPSDYYGRSSAWYFGHSS